MVFIVQIYIILTLSFLLHFFCFVTFIHAFHTQMMRKRFSSLDFFTFYLMFTGFCKD